MHVMNTFNMSNLWYPTGPINSWMQKKEIVNCAPFPKAHQMAQRTLPAIVVHSNILQQGTVGDSHSLKYRAMIMEKCIQTTSYHLQANFQTLQLY
ncbi:hypothetical protein DUNSADRAFT_13541 [Dunaliella salina]|uniref:Encoded protein n=1 Tax=Dunaliella salina TaxID=3046 RepID=A0ABQ7G948_DUNSA|nr:hypothetical protein DUNSADRAFT_13541 [Dunaliella salina]|eukprot:KAF5831138.1 hypothetical protein DUNSADRAFT_13541 [Dunaliella salina]